MSSADVPVTQTPVERLPQLLRDGLVLRQATLADRPQLLSFKRAAPVSFVAPQLTFLFEGFHPGFQIEDFLVVVDRDERIVSSLCLLQVRWRLGQTELLIGMPEYVATVPEFRGRGLIRAQFDVLHRWMKERGITFSLIGGIEYYYRQFGYEYAVEIPRAGYLTPEQHADQLTAPPGVEVRRMVESDIPAVLQLSSEQSAKADLSSEISAAAWKWFIHGQSLETTGVEGWISRQDGQPIGAARVARGWDKKDALVLYHFAGSEATARALLAAALAVPGITRLQVNSAHDSALGQLVARLHPGRLNSTAWYLRVNDPLLAFEHLRREFERRLAASAFAGLSRDVDLGFYRSGLRLVFVHGKLTQITPQPGEQDPKIGIPPDLLPKLLFGYRDLNQIVELYPDLQAGADWELLRVLFPRLQPLIYVPF